MAIRSSTDVLNSAITFINELNPNVRTEIGEPPIDVVQAFAAEQGKQYILQEYNRRINSVSGWQSIIIDQDFKNQLAIAFGVSASTLNASLARELGVPSDIPNDVEAIIFFDLNRFGESLGRPRRPATKSTGVERLFLSSNAAYTLLAGASLRTPGDNGVVFDTTTDLISVIPALDPAENLYFIDVGIQARVAGKTGNQIQGSIKVASPPIPGVNKATNIVPASNGFDRESNTDYVTRLLNAEAGSNVAVLQGLLDFVLSQPDVFDAIAILPGDPLMTRASAGAVDVYMIGTRLQTSIIQTKVIVAGEDFILPYQPVLLVNSAGPFLPPADFTFLKDVGVFAESAQALDKITWAVPPPNGPTAGTSLGVNFTFNDLPRTIQLKLDEDPNDLVPGASILIKLGTQLNIVVEMKVVILPATGFSQSTVETAVQDNINQNYFATLRLGDTDPVIAISKWIALAETTQINGINVVDRVDNFVQAVQGDPLTVNDIDVGKNEFGRLFSVTFL